MEGLLLRLSALDADAASEVRVIAFFDSLIARRVDLDTLLRTTAQLTECRVGLDAADRGLALAAEAVVRAGVSTPRGARVRELPDGARVWLARTGPALPLDDMVLERFAIAAELVLARGALPELGDPALVELVLAERAGEAERSRALHLLGLTPGTRVRVLAVADGAVELGGWSAPLGRSRAVLLAGPPELDLVRAPTRVGVGGEVAAIDARTSWRQARLAVRLAGSLPWDPPVCWWEWLGSLAAVAEGLRANEIEQIPDVRALDRLAAVPDLLLILSAVCGHDSVRKAGYALHRHHSSVTARLAQAETELGFPVTTPDGRFRLRLALLLRRLRDNTD
ncbi:MULTISPECIES: helix-turn-helix domain-containing protein [unclassified Crossiella]|uniref:helix-turn-helix domain-containing protein n=1 Tax=unclassified Crossiella TaxID=2620835 RepID=UPI002000169C|nr:MULTISPECIES: helix-turn-helix domain-containing protein [unclassified Crossiella]MCK2243785.1 helix-turn-helix domain-containing protein [Crossiella sp. S99.2]MCK2257644.1 helix-turn-helix domain-containing protein [Crossiella sp. S99.1]